MGGVHGNSYPSRPSIEHGQNGSAAADDNRKGSADCRGDGLVRWWRHRLNIGVEPTAAQSLLLRTLALLPVPAERDAEAIRPSMVQRGLHVDAI